MIFDDYMIRLVTSSTSCYYFIKVFIVVYWLSYDIFLLQVMKYLFIMTQWLLNLLFGQMIDYLPLEAFVQPSLSIM